jgi:hypothetical protein
LDLETFQQQVAFWGPYNFPGQPDWCPAMGVGEEAGELMHSHLKRFQGIRSNEKLVEKGKDALGDILVYAAHYCVTQGWSLQDCLDSTWLSVRERDWQQNPETGIISPLNSIYPWTEHAGA